MRLSFDEIKATQAAGVLLKLSPSRSMNYMALIKLLYMADREAIRQLGLPITTDHRVAMNYGPVTSKIYDRIKASANPANHPSYWSGHIQRNGHEVVLACDPGDGELSTAEERVLKPVFTADGETDRFDLAQKTHELFPEWTHPRGSSTPIELDSIADALALSEDEIHHLHELLEIQQASRQLAD
jgi:uncharacterized phage-associated protein